MKVRKITTTDGIVRWEVYGFVSGRGSKQLKRRFERKIDADRFVTDQKVQQAESGTRPRALFLMAERTFEEESRFWLTHRGVSFSPGHLRRAKDALDKWILPKMGKVTLDRMNPVVLSRFRVDRLEDGLKPATVNRETEVIMAILNFSVKQRRIPYNPAVGFTKLAETRDDMKFWERREAADFLEFADRKYPRGTDKRWVYAAYLLALNTALRAGEIWGLKVEDLTQGEELLHIQRQFDLVSRSLRPPKGKKARYVPCNSVIRAELNGLTSREKLKADQTFFRSLADTPVDHDNELRPSAGR